MDPKNLGGSKGVNKIKDQIQESFDIIQQIMIDILKELKANKVSTLTRIQNISNCDWVEVKDGVRAVEEVIHKNLAYKQKAPKNPGKFCC